MLAAPDMWKMSAHRLYSSAHFNDSFPQHSDPEVLKTPLEGVALIMKAMGIDKVCPCCLHLLQTGLMSYRYLMFGKPHK